MVVLQMSDLSLIYLTANLLPEEVAVRIRNNLVDITEDKYPIISVSQKRIEFGDNVCVGRIGASPYNYYKQILEGCYRAETEFVATCEDDTLYPFEHFEHRPQDSNYTFNTNAWLGGAKTFWRSSKPMNSFGFYISNRKALIQLLEDRFLICPEPPSLPSQRHFHEPGVWEHDPKGIEVERFKTKDPVIAFEHRGTLSGKRKRFGEIGVANIGSYNAGKLYKEYGFESLC